MGRLSPLACFSMHQLSIIIVNYRVPLLLGQCLGSVAAAIKNLDAEVWVVDNASGDGSITYLRERYPWVNYIENSENLGFSRANNMAIERSDSEFVLLLNPDTLIAEDTLTRCLEHLQQQPRCGAIGVKMHNIQGRYLRESKRGFPSTWVSFCKLSGLTRLFPKSKLFASYYMGHLPNDQTHSVEVLSGAFTMLRSKTLKEIGLLDERFFMYGEDIDLSYRVVMGGWTCDYLPTPIIHYKGESSILDSSKYIRSFYGAMALFYDKYYHGKASKLGKRIIALSISCLSMVAKVLAYFRRCKPIEQPNPIPVELPLVSLPEQGAHLLVDLPKYTHKMIINEIAKHSKQEYTYHFLNQEGKMISPRR